MFNKIDLQDKLDGANRQLWTVLRGFIGSMSMFASSRSEFAITLHDSNVQPAMKAIHCNSDGVVRVSRNAGGAWVDYTVIAGTQLPVAGDDVTIKATGGTATDLVGMNW